jgi:hypothetical protein
LYRRESSRSFTWDPGNDDEIPRSRPATCQPAVGLDPTADLHRDDERSFHRVATDECDVVSVRELKQPGRESFDPTLIARRHGQRQREPRWQRAHRRDVAQIHRECAIPDVSGIEANGKVNAFDDRIHRHDELAIGRHIENRGIIADTQTHIAASGLAREVTGNEFEFA